MLDSSLQARDNSTLITINNNKTSNDKELAHVRALRLLVQGAIQRRLKKKKNLNYSPSIPPLLLHTLSISPSPAPRTPHPNQCVAADAETG